MGSITPTEAVTHQTTAGAPSIAQDQQSMRKQPWRQNVCSLSTSHQPPDEGSDSQR